MCVCVFKYVYTYIPTNNHMLNQCIYSVVRFWKNKTMKHTNNLDETDWEKSLASLHRFTLRTNARTSSDDKFPQFWEIHFSFIEICQVGNGWLTRMLVLVLAPKIKVGSITLPMISALLTYSTHCYGASFSWSDGKLIALLSKSTSCHRKTREDTSTLKSTLSYSGN